MNCSKFLYYQRWWVSKNQTYRLHQREAIGKKMKISHSISESEHYLALNLCLCFLVHFIIGDLCTDVPIISQDKRPWRKEMQSDLKALFNIIWFTSIFSSLKIHLKEIHYLEHSDFSKGDFLYDRVIFWFQKPLDSHNLTRVPVSAFENNSIGSFTNFPNFFILLHHRGINLLKMDLHIVWKCRL